MPVLTAKINIGKIIIAQKTEAKVMLEFKVELHTRKFYIIIIYRTQAIAIA